MDKTEYRVKLDELTSLVEVQNYRDALGVADSVDWKRVKSVRTLSMVADVYEVNKNYKKCKEVLQYAYNRSMIGKMVVYRLSEISLKLGELDEADGYYHEFIEIAPNDNSRYVLEYKLLRARRASLSEQIHVLEEYKEVEYTERYAFELAKLYDMQGNKEKCVETCDDLVLWFADGKYVRRALELKLTIEPLSPSQQHIYNAMIAQDPKPVVSAYQGKNNRQAKGNTAGMGMTADVPNAAEVLKKMDEGAQVMAQNAKADRIPWNASSPDEGAIAPLDSPEFLGKTVNLKEQLAKSLQEVFAKAEVPEDTAEQEKVHTGVLAQDTGVIDIHDLEQETVEEEANPLPKEQAKTVITKVAPKEKAVPEDFDEEEPKNEPVSTVDQATLDAFDLSSLLNETADAFSRSIKGETESEITSESKAVSESGAELESKAVSESGAASDAAATKVIPSDIAAAPDATKEYGPLRERTPDATREIFPEEIIEATKSYTYSKNTVPMSVEDVLREETPEERRIRILNEGQPVRFTDEQKRIFSYLAKVPGIDKQVLDAMSGAYAHITEKTSKQGNIAIMGSYGTGKTRLSKGIVKAMAKDLGLLAVKFADIDASDLNQRDPAKVVAKMAGGFLLIERAGLLYPDIIEQLNRALEFRTDSLVVIIEDEKTSMRTLLRNHPEFAKKFENIISVPVFTNDELVSFARTYASENGFKIDEIAVLALYTEIGNNQTDAEPMTIGRVKDIMDKAITKANKKKFGRKQTDERGRIILVEKDFIF